MDNGTLAILLSLGIPIVAIVMGIGSGVVNRWMSYKLQMAATMTTQRTVLDEASKAEIEALRQEIMRLRDTTTQYDMSVERSLEELKHRVGTLETARRAGSSVPMMSAPTETDPEVVRLGQPLA